MSISRLSLVLLSALLTSVPLGAATVPAGFTDALVANVGATALAFTPDGRLLITTKSGALRIFQGGTLLVTPALTIPASSLCTESERGLLGVAVDPDFGTTRHIFLFYTFKKPGGGCVNRVSRYTLPDGNVIDPATQLVLIDEMPSPNGNHNAGDLHFGKDGHLYVSIGEGGINEAARLEHVLTGKILRITKSGGIPADNPFQGAGTARCNVTGQTTVGNKCQETFAWGLRNPFRFAMDPNAAGTRFFINDVGQGAWEEIDEGAAGADYGWNCREGKHPNSSTGLCSPTPPGMVDPIYEYAHFQTIPGTTSPTNCNSITGGAFVPNGQWPGFDGTYLFGDWVCGEIFKLTQSGGVWSASDFAQGVGVVTTMIFGPYEGGQALYYASSDLSGNGQVRRIANTPPSPSITSPAAGATFRVDQIVTLTGSATDAEDGTLPASALSWSVLLNHNGNHTHPWFSGTGNNLTFPAPAPEDLNATDGSFLEIHLTATDAGGLDAATQRNMQPSKVTLTLDTDPAGLDLTVNGTPITAPHSLTSWEGWGIDVYAPNQSDGTDFWIFTSWSDGGGQGHRIVTPAAPTTYTATFQTPVVTGPLDFFTATPCRLLDTRGAGPALAAGSTRTFTAVGSCGIPAEARAIAVSLAVIDPASPGHLRIWPGGTPATSTTAVNFAAGQVRSNNAVIGLGTGGDFHVLCAFPTGSAHLVVDVVGWFE